MAWWAGATIVLVGAGIAAAILLAGGEGTASTTVVSESTTTTTEQSSTTVKVRRIEGSIAPGRYIQAGSFKTVDHAELERDRLAADGIDVSVVSSDLAAELYPGFQVLLTGPYADRRGQAAMLKALHRNGVPSAFARDLSPAPAVGGPAGAEGRWVGELNRSSGEHPNLSGPLPVTLELEPGGETGKLEFETLGCRDGLLLREDVEAYLVYDRTRHCAAGGDLLIRPGGDMAQLSILPVDSDALVLGTLSPG
jgi:hypothetical protein